MEELELQERPGFFSRLKTKFVSDEPVEDDYEETTSTNRLRFQASYKYQITVRRQVLTFQDAVAAADGLKRGEAQILNLNMVDDLLREKIKDFMCGVNYAEEGTWEELGDNIYLLAPPQSTVDVAPASPRMAAQMN